MSDQNGEVERVGEGDSRLNAVEARGHVDVRSMYGAYEAAESSVGLHWTDTGIGLDLAAENPNLDVAVWAELSPEDARRLGESLIELAYEREDR